MIPKIAAAVKHFMSSLRRAQKELFKSSVDRFELVFPLYQVDAY